jgi:hypothetical protein
MLPSIWRLSSARSHVVTLATVAVVCVVTAVVFSNVEAPDAIWRPRLTDHPGFAPTDPPSVQQFSSSLGTSVGPTAAATELQIAALEAAGLGEQIDPVWFVALLTVVLAFLLTRAIGGSHLVAAAAGLALAFGGLFSSRALTAHPIIYGALLSLGSIAAVHGWLQSRRLWTLGLCTASYAAAVAVHPSALAALPVLVAIGWRTGDRTVGPKTTAAVISAALLGAAAFWSSLGSSGPVGAWFAPQGWTTMVVRFIGAGGILGAELGVLGCGFAAAGVVVLLAVQPRVLALLAGWCAAMVGWSVAFAPLDFRTALIPGIVPMWVIVGAGMAQSLRWSEDRTSRAAVTLLILALPVLNLLAYSHTAARSRASRAYIQRYLDRLESVLPRPSVLLAEGGLVDRSIESRSRGGEPRAWRRVPQDVSAIRTLQRDAASVIGFVGARTNLEGLGVHFSPVASAGVTMTLDELLETIPDGWIVAVTTGDRFTSDPAERETPFETIGGTMRVPSAERLRYGLIAVKTRRNHVLERAGSGAVDFGIAAGDPLGNGARAPVAMRVSSSEFGAAVWIGGERVAVSKSGVAIAIVTPTGELAGAFSAEPGEDLLVHPPGLAAGIVTDVEPCVTVAPGRWVDVSGPVGRTSVGGVIDSAQTLVLYLTSRDPLEPRLDPIHRRISAGLFVENYQRSDQRGHALQAAFARDGLAPAPGLADAAYVSRVEIRPGSRGRSQFALRVGGFIESAHAWLMTRDVASDVLLCSAMRDDARLFAGAAPPIGADVALAADDLFVYGWDRVEQTGARRFRWTLATSAGLLVPLSQPQDLQVEISATSAAGAGLLLLDVNDEKQAAIALRPGEAVYRWTVAADRWQSRLNRVRLTVSDLVRATDLGAADDDRMLGVSVTRIRLVRPQAPIQAQTAGRPGRASRNR